MRIRVTVLSGNFVAKNLFRPRTHVRVQCVHARVLVKTLDRNIPGKDENGLHQTMTSSGRSREVPASPSVGVTLHFIASLLWPVEIAAFHRGSSLFCNRHPMPGFLVS